VKLLQTTLQLGLRAAANDVERCLSLATWTSVNHCKAPPTFSGRTAVALYIQQLV